MGPNGSFRLLVLCTGQYTNYEAQVFHWFNLPEVPLLIWHQSEMTFAPLGRNSEICQGTSLPWPPKPPFLKASKLQHSSTISFRIGQFPNSIPTLRPSCTAGTKKISKTNLISYTILPISHLLSPCLKKCLINIEATLIHPTSPRFTITIEILVDLLTDAAFAVVEYRKLQEKQVPSPWHALCVSLSQVIVVDLESERTGSRE